VTAICVVDGVEEEGDLIQDPIQGEEEEVEISQDTLEDTVGDRVRVGLVRGLVRVGLESKGLFKGWMVNMEKRK
jgi:hypothetical protein